MTMEDGVLVRWLVDEGATVTSGTPLFEMETEKVELQVDADGEGTLRQLVAEGTKLEPGGIVGALLAPGESEVPNDIVAVLMTQWSAPASSGEKPPSSGAAASPASSAPPTAEAAAPQADGGGETGGG